MTFITQVHVWDSICPEIYEKFCVCMHFFEERVGNFDIHRVKEPTLIITALCLNTQISLDVILSRMGIGNHSEVQCQNHILSLEGGENVFFLRRRLV